MKSIGLYTDRTWIEYKFDTIISRDCLEAVFQLVFSPQPTLLTLSTEEL